MKKQTHGRKEIAQCSHFKQMGSCWHIIALRTEVKELQKPQKIGMPNFLA